MSRVGNRFEVATGQLPRSRLRYGLRHECAQQFQLSEFCFEVDQSNPIGQQNDFGPP